MFLRTQYARITPSNAQISTGLTKKVFKGCPATTNIVRDAKKYPINGTERTIRELRPNAVTKRPRMSW